MHSIEKLQTKQVGLKLPLYLLEDLEEITDEYDINRSTIITEAVRVYLEEYQQQKVHNGLQEALSEVKLMQEGKLPKMDARSLINELENQENH